MVRTSIKNVFVSMIQRKIPSDVRLQLEMLKEPNTVWTVSKLRALLHRYIVSKEKAGNHRLLSQPGNPRGPNLTTTRQSRRNLYTAVEVSRMSAGLLKHWLRRRKERHRHKLVKGAGIVTRVIGVTNVPNIEHSSKGNRD